MNHLVRGRSAIVTRRAGLHGPYSREANGATEMRDFKIRSGQMAAFIAAWRAGVVPMRQRHGFRIAGAWTVPSEDRFVWILDADGTRA